MSVPDSSGNVLPPNPDLRHLKLQAKSLLKSAKAGDAEALRRIEPYQSDSAKPTLAIAQLTIARQYGFESWTKLKVQVEISAKSYEEKLFTLLSEGWRWGDSRRARAALAEAPDISSANIFAACTTLDVDAVRASLGDDVQAKKLASKKGGPKKWPPILYATWSCFLADRQDEALNIIQLLVKHGADPNASWKNREYNARESALYGAVDANCQRVADGLLQLGADPNDGESLYHACENNNLAMLNSLAARGLNEHDISYCVKHAMDYRWEDGVQWFLDQGADPNAVHPTADETSLHWAVKRNCSLKTIKSLLDAGANPNARTMHGRSAFLRIKGWTPLDFAQRLGRTDVAELLREHFSNESKLENIDRFVIACARGDAEEARALVIGSPSPFQEIDDDDRRLIAHVAQIFNTSR